MPQRDPLPGRPTTDHSWRRREYLVATAGIVASSGCASDSGGGAETEEPGDEDLPEGVSAAAFERGPVPDVYRSATSLGAEQRDPDAVRTKAQVSFSEYDEAVDTDAHESGTCCGNCADYIPDKNGDAFGACAAVEGYIAVEEWCASWEPVTAER